ncbi:MAG: (2Fe-2S) ferredoxin domain-containing protein [Planctomycetota bacterium]
MSKAKSSLDDARRKASKLGFDAARYTVILCMDQKVEKCCSAGSMKRTWQHLKRRAKELGKSNGQQILRIKSACIGVCKGGPIIGVFPDGVWYGACTPKVVDRIVDEHLVAGKIVQDYVIAKPSGVQSSK